MTSSAITRTLHHLRPAIRGQLRLGASFVRLASHQPAAKVSSARGNRAPLFGPGRGRRRPLRPVAKARLTLAHDATVTFGPRAAPLSSGFFSFLYLKKIKISKIYGGFEKFQKLYPCRPGKERQGACRPLAGRQDLNVKKITFRSWRPGRIKQRTCKIDIKS